jgi:hypothetical protein
MRNRRSTSCLTVALARALVVLCFHFHNMTGKHGSPSPLLCLALVATPSVSNLIFLIRPLDPTPAYSRPYATQIGPLPVPNNVSLVLVKWYPPAIKVTWHLNSSEAELIKEVQVIFSPLKSKYVRAHPDCLCSVTSGIITIRLSSHRKRVRNMMKVKPLVRDVLLENLLPHHEYELELVSVSINSMVTNATPSLHFISPSNG